MKHVAIVIVNWNGIGDTSNCLDSIRSMKIPSGIQIKTIVVDNGSTDRSISIVQKKYPWVHLIDAGSNLGFTGGNNKGIKYAQSEGVDFVWLLNNDTLLDTQALRLVEAFDDPAVGIAGSKIYFAPGHEYHHTRYAKSELGKVIWYAGGLIDWGNVYASHKGVDEVDHGQYDQTQETQFVTGCSLMIRAQVIDRIGFLDEHFYLYLEDVDYNLRAKKAGFSLKYYPKSVLWHVNAGSSGGPGNTLHEYYQTRNRLLVGMRYASVRTKVALIREAGSFILTGSNIKRRAVLDAMTGKWGNQYELKKINH